MPITFAESQQEIAALVKHFRTNLNLYRAPGYKEAEARQEFIDPLFITLGWDVANKQHLAPMYKEVIFEESREIEGATKAPDYTFRVGREAIFFVEAKRPGINLKSAVEPAYQVRRYAWSQKLPLSILTDFEEFAVYDGRIRPNAADKASVARVNFYGYEEYADRWREIWDVFSREAVLAGSFQQYVESEKGRRGTSEVDVEFLKDIERWRDQLARNIALRNLRLSLDDLNDMVQRLIDRIVFLRIAEDRGIEPQERLKHLTDADNIYARLMKQFYAADGKYNSGLFDFSKSGDGLSPRLKVDDQTLRQIILDLYYPRSPYQFDRIPVEILGNVYEQFLGKVIKLTDAHHAKVEEKPEVKKAGGVYYTPAYIVDYIVKQTIGTAIEGKSPKQLEKFRVLDMACGSGSFLLGAYQYLLDYYLKWYVEQLPQTKAAIAKKVPLTRSHTGEWRLTIAEKKHILTAHIFGVDIDRQAVEVTKLSLLLKVLEGESDETLQMRLFDDARVERALPNLDANVKCGNSLIGPDYFADQLLSDESELRRVNPFDWQREFPETMKAGGFDCVIGNPPYVRQESLAESKAYMSRHYRSFNSTADLYVYFIERGLSLLRPSGFFSIIVSSSFLRATYAAPLRRHMRGASAILSLVDFGGLSLFENAKDVYVCIPVIGKRTQPEQVTVCKADAFNKRDLDQYVAENQYTVSVAQFTEEAWSSVDERITATFAKVTSHGITLSKYVDSKIFYGIKTGLNEAFEIDLQTRDQILKSGPHCARLTKPFLGGQDIRRYFVRDSQRYLIVIPAGWTLQQIGKGKVSESEAWGWLSKAYRPLAQHLAAFEAAAKRRQDQGDFWWELRPCDYYDVLDAQKIIYPDITKNPRFYLDTSGHYLANTAYALGTDDRYLLGILNSKLFWFSISNISIPFGIRAGEYRYRLIYQYMEKVPIHPINFSNPAEKARHDRMVNFVQRMLNLHKQLQTANSEATRQRLQREIDTIDEEIDQLVYELYGLTKEEIKVVEGKK